MLVFNNNTVVVSHEKYQYLLEVQKKSCHIDNKMK